ncbi:hypothetical protein NQ315_015871 [Exocentrus adspersus]|uniref:Large ribosomal subunit protein uL3m n=1 Tax=Exocentrus adspersus TaxID=1586481 RepID=A0AAV8W428_9CUCU|nr:hypothetical protein NQ315_015871 [Exocentrus adspersus]
MATSLANIFHKCSVTSLENKFLTLSITCSVPQTRKKSMFPFPPPRLRNPTWFTKKNRSKSDEYLTPENREFVKEVVQDTYNKNLPLAQDITTNVEWTPKLQRTGVIARKIGIYPLWMKDGKKVATTLLQVLDNHVIHYYPPEEYQPVRKIRNRVYNKKGCLLIGAEEGDPTAFTKEYCGLFTESGVMPKKILSRFFVSPDATLPLGASINALHFQVGNYVDVRGKTIDRGFQGVMKRHGFKGMPASHGVTKTHRRGGCIGGGGEKGRVWPGTKMPGHMGNKFRVAKGLKIYRINTRYNVLWVSGQAIPGETNSIVYVYDTKLPLRAPTKPLPFPTYLQELDESMPEDVYDESVHVFSDPTIFFKGE